MPTPPVLLPTVLLHEVVLQADASRVELLLWRSARGFAYRLECAHAGALLVRYDNETPRGHLRSVLGRVAPYEFRSVEQLRYDFERDAQAALR